MAQFAARATGMMPGLAVRIAGAERTLLLDTVAPDHAAAASRLYRRRAPLSLRVAGRDAALSAIGCPPDRDPGVAHHAVQLSIDGRSGELRLPRPLLDLLLGALDPTLAIDALSAAQAALMLELALADGLDALEAATGCHISLLALAPAAAGDRRGLSDVALDIAGFGRTICGLTLAPADLAALAQLLDRAAGDTAASADDLPVPVCLRVGAATPSFRDLRSTACGDVILFDDACPGAAQAVAVIGEHLVAPVAVDAAGGHLGARPERGRQSAWEWSMDKQADAAAVPGIADADLDDLPVRVVFEIGRIELPLGEVRRLGAGAMIPLARPAEDSVDVVAHGRRIGHGTLIRIGDSIGIRLTRLFDHG